MTDKGTSMQLIPFTKAVALGNDFVLLHKNYFIEGLTFVRRLADRRHGIGFDQLVIYDDNYFIRFFNANGSEAEACGNGSRCVAYYLMRQHNQNTMTFHTQVGPLHAEILNECYPKAQVKMTMHPPKVIQKTKEIDDDIHWFLDKEAFTTTFVIDVGNPHLVIFVRNQEDVNIDVVAPQLEKHPFFKNGVNISFVTAHAGANGDDACLFVNVWERGVGPTPACGTAAFACAFAYSLLYPHYTQIVVDQKGGQLLCNKGNDHWFITGEAALAYEGQYYVAA